MDYHTPLRDLLGKADGDGAERAVHVAGHVPYGEWQLHGPLGAPTSATVTCAYCRQLLSVSKRGLVMSRRCAGPTP